VIDLGPPNAEVRQQLQAAIVAGGLAPVLGDGVDDALAGVATDRDAIELATALAEAQRAFGALDCAAARTAGARAGGIAAARQAAGLPVPELARAWTYVLLCADRAGDPDAAAIAAARVRAAGGSPDVPADVWRKYPEVDAVSDRELIPLQITTDVANAAVWIDGAQAGRAPLDVLLPAGEHVIAVAAGTRRGWAAGVAVKSQTQLAIPTTDQATASSEIAARVAGWRGAVPAPAELAWVLGKVHARVAVVRRGDTVEAWGRLGLAEPPHRLGGEDAVAPVAEARQVIALIADRVQAWNDRSPDPDQPLLVDDRRVDVTRKDPPTKWWVYATIAGALVGAAVLVYAYDAGSDRQRVEIHLP
jgi:hypothetical protein